MNMLDNFISLLHVAFLSQILATDTISLKCLEIKTNTYKDNTKSNRGYHSVRILYLVKNWIYSILPKDVGKEHVSIRCKRSGVQLNLKIRFMTILK